MFVCLSGGTAFAGIVGCVGCFVANNYGAICFGFAGECTRSTHTRSRCAHDGIRNNNHYNLVAAAAAAVVDIVSHSLPTKLNFERSILCIGVLRAECRQVHTLYAT